MPAGLAVGTGAYAGMPPTKGPMPEAVTTTIELDAVQRRVVDHDGGPLLVLGSPGTGKTTVLVERWVRLATGDVEPHRVLLLLPTRDRALALRDELPFRLPQTAVLEVPVHTWHALAYHLVTRYYRRLGYTQPPIRLTTAEQSAVVRDLLNSENVKKWGRYGDHLLTDAFVSEVADFCVRSGHRGLHDEDLEALGAERPEHAAVAEFTLRYREHLRGSSALDYAELVLAATRLLMNEPDISEAVKQRFTHVLVDDAQELAPAQLQLLRQLNTQHARLRRRPRLCHRVLPGSRSGLAGSLRRPLRRNTSELCSTTCHRYGKSHRRRRVVVDLAFPRRRIAIALRSFLGPDDGSAELRVYSTMAGELEAVAREIRSAHLLHHIPYDRMADPPCATRHVRLHS